MCGRTTLIDWSKLKIKFRVSDDLPTPDYPPRYNLSLTQVIPIIHYDPEAGRRVASLMRCARRLSP